MNKDNRISNLPENKFIASNSIEPFPHRAQIHLPDNSDDDLLFLVTNSGSHNEKVRYKNLKSSMLDNVALLTGNQLISGDKTFADPCTFLSTIYINEIIDITQTGDISGNIFVGESGLFERVGVGLHYTDRRIIKDIYSDYPNFESGYVEYNYGGGIDPITYSGGLDFLGIGQPNLETSVSSYPIYEPSGYYNSTIPLSQQNFENDLSLDGHSLLPDEIHREMGGAWVGVDFPEEFNYRGFSVFRSDIENSAEKFKVVASNNGQDWVTVHREENLGIGSYANTGEASVFTLDAYCPEKYSKYRLVAQKIISGDFWKFSHFNFSGVEFHEHVKTVHPQYTLHVSGDSCFIGDVTITGDFRIEGDSLTIGDTFLSGNLGQTGNYYALGNEYRIGDFKLSGNFYQTGDLYRKGDSNLVGDISQTGNSRLIGDTFRSGETNLIGDVNLTGNTVAIGDIYRSGDSFQVGDHTQTGDVLIYGDETVTGDIYLGEYLYHLDDEDTHLRFTDNSMELSAGAESKIIISDLEDSTIQFFTSGEEQARINKQGFLAVNNTTPLGELSVTGDSYLECAFTTGQDGQWERIFGGSDEVVSFVTPILGGQDVYKIDFPKTFGETPAISISLENDFGGPIVPYMISGLNNFEYYINFGATLQNDGYKIHTSARPTGQSSVHKTTTQSFVTELVAGQDIYEITYPTSFHAVPNISTVIESDQIIYGYFISGINKDSYNVVFGSNLNLDCKIHTHAVR
jgi:hypothetical protein